MESKVITLPVHSVQMSNDLKQMALRVIKRGCVAIAADVAITNQFLNKKSILLVYEISYINIFLTFLGFKIVDLSCPTI